MKKNNIKALLINLVSIVLVYIVLLSLTGNNFLKSLIITILINVILAVSLNLTVGFLGELALGHAGFMAVGAYASAIYTMNVRLAWLPGELNFIVALIFGGLVAAIFGVIIGIPALRLKGDYLAIITLGFGEIIRVIIQNLTITGGARGLRGISRLTDFNNIFWVAVIIIAFIFTFARSRHGRAITAIREDSIAAEAAGIPVTYYKILTFTISAFFAGVGGAMYAHYITVLGAENFSFMKSIEFLVMVVLGGMGSITGSIVAAVTLISLPELLREFSNYRMVIYSLILVGMMIFKPSGLLGRHEFSMARAIDKTVNYIGKISKKGRKS